MDQRARRPRTAVGRGLQDRDFTTVVGSPWLVTSQESNPIWLRPGFVPMREGVGLSTSASVLLVYSSNPNSNPNPNPNPNLPTLIFQP